MYHGQGPAPALKCGSPPQTGFGMLGLREAIGDGPEIVGRVVISTSDAVKSYQCSDVFAKRAHFSVPHVGASRAPKVNHRIQLLKVPEHAKDRADVMATLGPKGWSTVVSTNKHGLSCVCARPNGTAHAAVAIINDPSATGTATLKYKRTRLHVIKAAAALEKKFKTPVVPVILTSTHGLFTYHRLQSRTPV